MTDPRPAAASTRVPTLLPWSWLVHGALLLITSWQGCIDLPGGSGYGGLYKVIPLGAVFVGVFGIAMGLAIGRAKEGERALRIVAGAMGLGASVLAALLFLVTAEYLGRLWSAGMGFGAIVYLASPLLYVVTLVAPRRPLAAAPLLPAIGAVVAILVAGHYAFRDNSAGARSVRREDERRATLGRRIADAVAHEDPVALATPEMWQWEAKRPFLHEWDDNRELDDALALAIETNHPGAVRILLAHKPPDAEDLAEAAVGQGNAAVLAVYLERGIALDGPSELRTALCAKSPNGLLFLVAHGVSADRLLCLAAKDDSEPYFVQKERLRYVPELLAHGGHPGARCEEGDTIEARLATARARAAGPPPAPNVP